MNEIVPFRHLFCLPSLVVSTGPSVESVSHNSDTQTRINITPFPKQEHVLGVMEARVLVGDCSHDVFEQHHWMLENRNFSSDDESDHSDEGKVVKSLSGFVGKRELRTIVLLVLRSLAHDQGRKTPLGEVTFLLEDGEQLHLESIPPQYVDDSELPAASIAALDSILSSREIVDHFVVSDKVHHLKSSISK